MRFPLESSLPISFLVLGFHLVFCFRSINAVAFQLMKGILLLCSFFIFFDFCEDIISLISQWYGKEIYIQFSSYNLCHLNENIRPYNEGLLNRNTISKIRIHIYMVGFLKQFYLTVILLIIYFPFQILWVLSFNMKLLFCSMASRQVNEVPLSNVGGSPFCIAVCSRGMDIQQVSHLLLVLYSIFLEVHHTLCVIQLSFLL